MAESDRDPTDYVQLKIRCRERLRAQLEAEARKSDHSLNNEVVQRLERSFTEDVQRREIADIQGGWKTARLIREITKVVQFFGADCSPEEEALTRAMLGGAITAILNERLSGWPGLMGAPMATPKPRENIIALAPELEQRARARGAMIGHQVTLTTRAAEDELARGSAAVSDAKGETLLQSAVRLGLVAEDEAEAFAAPQSTNKKPKK